MSRHKAVYRTHAVSIFIFIILSISLAAQHSWASTPLTASAPELLSVTDGKFWLYIGICAVLVLSGGIISGLTIGLFSLSNLELEVLQEDIEADEADRRRAKKLQPLLREERHHLLLVTLLLTNTAMMEALPEILDKLVPEWAAVVISVSLVLVFSEILPQSICTRAPLAVGAFFSPLVWLLMIILLPVAWPIAKALDCLIGKEGGPQFLASRSQVTSLLEIIKRHNILSHEEARLMQAVVQLKTKQIKDVMIPFEQIYMLHMNDELTKEKLHEIQAVGHSRIPVYRGSSRHNIQGLLLTKRLIVVDPEQGDLVSKYADIKPVWAKPNTDIFSILDEFEQGKSHIAIVSEDLHDVALKYHAGADLSPTTQVLGMVTFEDITEAMMTAEFPCPDDTSISLSLSSTSTQPTTSNSMTTTTVSSTGSSMSSSTSSPSLEVLNGLTRGKKARRILDPYHAKPSTLNEMLSGLTILAEQKGFTTKGEPGQPAQMIRRMPKIPLKRSATISSLRGRRATPTPAAATPSSSIPSSSSSSSQQHQPRRRMNPAGATAAVPIHPNSQSNKRQTRVRWQPNNASDPTAYQKMSDVEEGAEEEDVEAEVSTSSSSDRPALLTTPESDLSVSPMGIVISSAESASHSPQNMPSARARSEIVTDYAQQRAQLIFTPMNDYQTKHSFNFSPPLVPQSPSTGPVLVQELMENGTVRLTIAVNRDTAVQNIAALNREADDSEAQKEAQKLIVDLQEKEKDDSNTSALVTFAEKILAVATGTSSGGAAAHPSSPKRSGSSTRLVDLPEPHDSDTVLIPSFHGPTPEHRMSIR